MYSQQNNDIFLLLDEHLLKQMNQKNVDPIDYKLTSVKLFRSNCFF